MGYLHFEMHYFHFEKHYFAAEIHYLHFKKHRLEKLLKVKYVKVGRRRRPFLLWDGVAAGKVICYILNFSYFCKQNKDKKYD